MFVPNAIFSTFFAFRKLFAGAVKSWLLLLCYLVFDFWAYGLRSKVIRD